MKVLVIGGTGTVGSQVVLKLLALNVNVQVLTRNPADAAALPAGAQALTGDLLDPGTLRSIFRGQDGVFMLTPFSLSLMSDVSHLVYMSVHDLERAPHLPHFGAKLPIETVIKSAGMPYTILRPNNFYQNDYAFKDALLHYGVYPQPIGDLGVSRVDVRDIAEAAAITLTTSGHAGQTYNLVGPDAHTGQSSATAWSQALGKPIVYGGNDLDAWEQQTLAYLPSWIVFDLRLMYAFMQKEGYKATPADIERQTQLLGHAPRRFIDFARETAATWMAG
jgi:uncharacterized protein YbjT (DUF2867 family)